MEVIGRKVKMELVSYIMPVFNVKDYVEESIQSILNQDYSSIELIIVDDCSTDGTYEFILEKFGSDDRVTLVRNETNSQIVKSLNRALSIAKGKYIARIDGDDVAMVDRTSKQMHYLKMKPDIDLVGFSLISINENGAELSKSDFPETFDLLKKIAYFSSPVSHIWLAKRCVYESLSGYRFHTVEDYDFLLRMITSGYKFANIPNYYGMKIRVRGGNTVSIYGVKQRKAYNFARDRYRERLNFGVEKTAEGRFIEFISSDRYTDLHRLSMRFSNKAVHTKSLLVKYTLYGLSCIISPYQFQYISHTIIRRLYIKFHKGSHLK
jgi:glycosyltransferase involved in cell wall biosynthesis